MDPTPKLPQPNIKKPKYPEHDYVMVDIEQGKPHVAWFRGQINLYIPQVLVDAVGKEEIRNLAESIYGKETLEKFNWTQSDYRHSLMLELPPQRFNKEKGEPDQSDDRVERLIAAIKNYFK